MIADPRTGRTEGSTGTRTAGEGTGLCIRRSRPASQSPIRHRSQDDPLCILQVCFILFRFPFQKTDADKGRAGSCEKGRKCKFSHDLGIERKAEKKSLYADSRDDRQSAPISSFDLCSSYSFAHPWILLLPFESCAQINPSGKKTNDAALG